LRADPAGRLRRAGKLPFKGIAPPRLLLFQSHYGVPGAREIGLTQVGQSRGRHMLDRYLRLTKPASL
jgi:hypothetical protein